MNFYKSMKTIISVGRSCLKSNMKHDLTLEILSKSQILSLFYHWHYFWKIIEICTFEENKKLKQNDKNCNCDAIVI